MNPIDPSRRHFLGLAGLACDRGGARARDATARATRMRTPRQPDPPRRRPADLAARLRRDADHRPGHLGRTRRRAHLRAVLPRDRSRRRLHRHRERHGPQVSERLIAEGCTLPKALVIATKGGYARSGPDRWSPDCRPESLRAACEGSLRRLKLERIDLYQLRGGPQGPLRGLDRRTREAAAGGQDPPHRHLERAARTPRRARALVKVVSVQNRYNVFDRSADRCSPAASGTAWPSSLGTARQRGPRLAAARWHR